MLKKLSYLAAVIFVATAIFFSFSSDALAEFVGPDQSKRYNTIKDVLDHPVDDVKVSLKGKIITKISWNRYIFKDDTGEITVKIKPHKLAHVEITPETAVEIFGEIEVRYVIGGPIEIEVDHITVIGKKVEQPYSK